MSKEPNWLDCLLDPGILQRRHKIDQWTFARLVANVVFAALSQAAAKPGVSMEEASDNVRDWINKEIAREIADLEAIDKPMPEGL